MKCINAICIFALLAVFIFSVGASAAAPDLKSEKPRFARIVISKDAAKAITVIFDESKGTGKGYDTVYADVNMDGEFSVSEKLADLSRQSELPDGVIMHTFENINIPALTIRGKSKHDISFESIRFDNDEIFGVTIQSVRYVNNNPYQYTYYGDLKPSTNIDKPFVWISGKPAAIKLDVKPDGKNTGIAISLSAGNASIYSQSVTVDLVIKNSGGKVVKTEKGNLDKFAFGWGGTCQYSVRIPSGRYTVETAVNTGPLAGIIKSKKVFVVK